MHTEIQNSFSFWGTSSPDPYRGFAPGPHWGTSVPRPPAQDVPPYSLFVHVRLLRVLNKDQSINQSILYQVYVPWRQAWDFSMFCVKATWPQQPSVVLISTSQFPKFSPHLAEFLPTLNHKTAGMFHGQSK